MLDEKTRALLGDREAQEAFTARGELLPCPICGKEPDVLSWRNEKKMMSPSMVRCSCGLQTRHFGNKKRTIKQWNQRAPLLTPTQMAALERETGKSEEGLK